MSELTGVFPSRDLAAIARRRKSQYEFITVPLKNAEELQAQGWTIVRQNAGSARLHRPKPIDVALEDRVWALLYRMGFTLLSTDRQCLLQNSRDHTKNQIDVFGMDDDVAIAIECKASAELSRRSTFQREIGKFHLLRQSLAEAVRRLATSDERRLLGMVFFLQNISLSDPDEQRAANSNIRIFNEDELRYYEELTTHLKDAARFQFLADVFQGREIPGLNITVPAIRSSMAGKRYYSFSLRPEQLLKIAYVSHRGKGRASDLSSYQRMMSRSRLNAVRRYIDSNDAIFPTNIVLNLDSVKNFQRSTQQGTTDADLLGWLTLHPTYRSAWVIDGQHRLYSYAGLERASTASLSVVAFEGLQASTQAQLFVDINGKQKSVKQALLQELYAQLHWDAQDPAVRLRAVISMTIQRLDKTPSSPFYRRILASEERRSATRCINFNSLYRALDQPELFVTSVRRGRVPSYGPLYSGDDNSETIERTAAVLNYWFGTLRNSASDWWDLGAADGGGLSMAGSVVSQVMVLRSVFNHLETTHGNLVKLETNQLLALLSPFAEANGVYHSGITSAEERKKYRDLTGIQGQTTRARRCQLAIRRAIPSFDFRELQEFSRQEEAQTNQRSTEIVKAIEVLLQRTVIDELKAEYGTDEIGWWIQGIPAKVRTKASRLYEEDDGKRGGKEYYLDLIDYRDIAQDHWLLFRPILGRGKANSSKNAQTQWIVEVNEIRKVLMHASSGKNVSIEQMDSLLAIQQWLEAQNRNDDTELLNNVE